MPKNSLNIKCFVRLIKIVFFRTDVFNDIAVTKMFQKASILRRIFMAEAKIRPDSRQRRPHKIATTLERELHFDVFRLSFKTVFDEFDS